MIDSIIGKEFPEKVIPLIEQSKNSIDIIVFDWRWYPQDLGNSTQSFNQALVRAGRRNVKIRAIVNSGGLVKTLKDVGIEAKKLSMQRLIHCKLMIFDNDIAVVGSHNYTESAFQMNLELSVIVKLSEDDKRIINFFNNLWQL